MVVDAPTRMRKSEMAHQASRIAYHAVACAKWAIDGNLLLNRWRWRSKKLLRRGWCNAIKCDMKRRGCVTRLTVYHPQ